MTPEAQRIEIGWATGLRWTRSPDGDKSMLRFLPDYLNDLNDMRKAALHLRSQDRFKYAIMHKELERLVAIGNSIDDEHSWQTADATSAQRARAFLMAIGRWTE